ncbi:hypothetical protein QE152_g6785 [Popillia japonica]|uniref:Uncharacterized protein n=1 Tax=Popillia japonica TaxID=7064 RepID=A0AAW1MFQ8_POPJA
MFFSFQVGLMPDKENEVELIVADPVNKQLDVKSPDEAVQNDAKCDKEVQVSVPMLVQCSQSSIEAFEDRIPQKAYIEEVQLFLKSESNRGSARHITETVINGNQAQSQPEPNLIPGNRKSFIKEMHLFLNNDLAEVNKVNTDIEDLQCSEETWLVSNKLGGRNVREKELDEEYPIEFDIFNEEVQSLYDQGSEVIANADDKSENDKEVAIIMSGNGEEEHKMIEEDETQTAGNNTRESVQINHCVLTLQERSTSRESVHQSYTQKSRYVEDDMPPPPSPPRIRDSATNLDGISKHGSLERAARRKSSVDRDHITRDIYKTSTVSTLAVALQDYIY